MLISKRLGVHDCGTQVLVSLSRTNVFAGVKLIFDISSRPKYGESLI